MKKIVSMMMVFILVLSGCSSSTKEAKYTELDSSEEVTLKVMAWGMGTEEDTNNIGRKVISEYEMLNPNVNIEIITTKEGEDYNEVLNTMAAAGDMPDVFMHGSAAEVIANGWAMDMIEYTNNDESYKTLFPILNETQMVEGKVYQLPVGLQFMGFWQNNTLLKSLNVKPLEWNYTIEEWTQNVLDSTTSNSVGADSDSMLDWYAPVMDDTISWFNFDGEKYDFSNETFKEGFELRQELCAANAINVCTSDPIFVEGEWPIATGKVAYQMDGTWANLDKDHEPEWEFIGLPNGQFTITPDYMYVSSTTQNPEWAYDFVKFFGEGSYNVRYDHAIAEGGLPPIPMTSNEEHIKKYKDYHNNEEFGQPNLNIALDGLIAGDAGLVEGYKTIAGYPKSRFEGDTGILNEETQETYTVQTLLDEISKGKLNYEDYEQQLTDIANQELSAAQALLQ